MSAKNSRISMAERLKAIREWICTYGVLFIPGALLVACGLLIAFVPAALHYVGALLLVGLGALSSFAVWKVLLLKKKVEVLIKNIEGKVYIHTGQVRSPLEQFDASRDEGQQKKIVFH